MDDYNIFDYWDGDEKRPKSKFEGLSNDEVIEILKQELLEKEEKRRERKKEKNKRLSKQRRTRSIKNIVPRWNYYLSG